MSHHGPTGVWSFQPGVERRLMAEVSQGYRVLIIFAVTGSQAVQGAAIFTGQTMREGSRIGQKLEWVSYETFPSLDHLNRAKEFDRSVTVKYDHKQKAWN
jgi:hypothetical protein